MREKWGSKMVEKAVANTPSGIPIKRLAYCNPEIAPGMYEANPVSINKLTSAIPIPGIQVRNFKRIFKERGLNDKFLVGAFPYFLESRLVVILYRSNFFNSIFMARQFINHKKIFVNGLLETKPGLKVLLNDMISLPNYQNFYLLLTKRLKKKKVLINYQNCDFMIIVAYLKKLNF